MSQYITTTPSEGRRPRVWGHLLGSATGAANDNFFRLAFTAAIQRLAPDDAETLKPLLGLLFILPMLIMAPTAGTMGDRLPARRLMLSVRWAEILLVILGGMALWYESIPLMLVVLAGFGLQTAFFSPIKYACMPDLTPGEHLPRGNGLLQAATSLAILGGTALVFALDPALRAATPLADWERGTVALVVGATLAVIGIIATYAVPRLAAHNPAQPIATPFALPQQFRSLSRIPGLWGPTLSLSAFWALGAMGQLVVVGAAMAIFGFNEAGTALLVVILGLGTAVGGLTASPLLVHAAPRALPTIGATVAGGAFALACLSASGASPIVFNADLHWLERQAALLDPELFGFAGWLFITGIGGGWWAVSCNTLLQQRSDPKQRSLAYSGINVVTNLGIIAGFCALLLAPFLGLVEIEAGILFGALSAAGGLVAVIAYRMDLARWGFSLVCRWLWRVQVHGLEHLPSQGGCVVVANHQSFADGPLLTACLSRPTRPLVHASYVVGPLRSILRAGGCISVKPGGGRNLVAAIDEAVAAASAGEVVVVFAEGKLSRGVDLDRFQTGAERIAKRAAVPIIPLRIDGLMGSMLSRSLWRAPWRWRRPVFLRLGPALPTDSPTAAIRQAVQHLGHLHARAQIANDPRTLGRAALAQARRHPWTLLGADITGSRRRLSLCAGAMVLGRHFELAQDEQRVGVLLPPGMAGSAVLLALALQGRCAVPLNHTVGEAGMARMAEIANLRTIISARAYLKRIGEPACPGRVVLLEDLKPRISMLAVILRMLAILLLPHRWLDRAAAGDDAAVVFSSGSTGDPKGIRLSHRAILTNGEAALRHLGLSAQGEGLLSPLPIFHSFGLSIGSWLPLCQSITMIAHGDPFDARSIGELAQRYKPSFLVSTPTFVRGWMRRIEPEQFRSLRFVVVGAEACPLSLHEAFQERYGIPLFEGYGATELGPMVSVGTPDNRDHDVHEIGSRRGSVGRPAPGIEVFTVDPQSRRILPVGRSGLLIVRSPSRMSGYLHNAQATAEACILEGYNTGDMGRVDDEGFIHLEGRLSRFAKIAGEMVPLDRIEGRIHEWLAHHHARNDGSDWNVALCAVADAEKGERLLLLHDEQLPCTTQTLIDGALMDEPPLFRPKPHAVHLVKELPTLGTGKRDLAALRRLAEDLAS